jgi:hypothetical protein
MKRSESLVKKEISSFQFDPEPSDTTEDKALLKKLRKLCSVELTSAKSVKQLKVELKKFAKVQAASVRMNNLVEDILGELDEIGDDIKFAGSPKGRFILFFNDWAQPLHKKIRSQKKFNNAYLVADPKNKTIVVTGSVPSEKARRELEALVKAHPPGVKVVWRVTYGRSR